MVSPARLTWVIIRLAGLGPYSCIGPRGGSLGSGMLREEIRGRACARAEALLTRSAMQRVVRGALPVYRQTQGAVAVAWSQLNPYQLAIRRTGC